MPQFDFTHVLLPQMVWLAALFAILYFVVVRATLPKLGKVMQDREDKVLGDLNEAHAAKVAADTATEAYQVALRKVQEEARASLAAARGNAQKSVEAKLADIDGQIASRIEVAQTALDDARMRAAGEIEAIAADAAGSIVERLTGARPAGDQATAAARAALGQG